MVLEALLVVFLKFKGMKKVKKYVFQFALFMILWTSFNALIRVGFDEDPETWTYFFFGVCLLVITDVIDDKIFNCN